MSISLKPVNELLGMNFFIPDYQRGYRWEKQQVEDLLNDIDEFMESISRESNTSKIYCLQPLVLSKKDEDILKKCKAPESTLEDIKKYIKGFWTVVDGQQRLTTIYLILSFLKVKDIYEIDYQTREKSKTFLANVNIENANDNIDYYYMYNVFKVITEWFQKKNNNTNGKYKEKFESVLLNHVNFIWYEVDPKDEISAFTRLNIGKIPLTDAELIKALFLNRKRNDIDKNNYDDNTIALQWDLIEHSLQNDEFWLFIHSLQYDKPTRIDLILDIICDKNVYDLNVNYDLLGNDNHKTFRYFYEAFKRRKTFSELWSKVYQFYQIFDEWYQDYKLFHYIGFLLERNYCNISELIDKWMTNKTKEKFINDLKETIAKKIKGEEWISRLYIWKFEDSNEKKKVEKTKCVPILLLHNIETIIQQNEKFIQDTKYNLPNFTKFPFHLYKREKWQVEHIRPNAGDDLSSVEKQKLYLLLAKEFCPKDLQEKIEYYLDNGSNEDNSFSSLFEEISGMGNGLLNDDKNRIWNYTLLDESTNKEYQNQIFPVKRMFIANKSKGIKIKYSIENGKLKKSKPEQEIAFVPPCTWNVFAKFYTEMPTSMMNWNRNDAEAYWNDMADKLDYYFKKWGVKKDEVTQ